MKRRAKFSDIIPVFLFATAVGSAAADPSPRDADFLRAVGRGDVGRVKVLLDEGAHPDAKGINGVFALETAIDQAEPAIVTLLLDRGANVNLADDFGTTALIAAAKNSREEAIAPLLAKHADVHAGHDGAIVSATSNANFKIVERLLAAGANPNAKDDGGRTLLMLAAPAPEITKLLLSHGAPFDANAADNTGATLLMSTAATGSIAAVRSLLDHGANLQARDRDGRTLLMKLPLNTLGDAPVHLEEMIKFVVGKGIDINARDHDGDTALHLAVASHVTESGGHVAHREVVQALLDAGADLNRRNSRGDTALHLILAAIPPRPEVARLLLEHGADPNLANQEGLTPVMIAAQKAEADVVHLLLERHADPNTADAAGDTAFRFAVESGRPDIVQVFLDGGLVRFASQPYRNFAEALKAAQNFRLMTCAENGDARGVKELLDENADVNARDRQGRTPLMRAAGSYRSTPEVVAALLDHQADVSAQDNDGETALALAAANNQPDLMRLLIEKGANPNVRDKRGRTPLLAAIDSERCVLLLLDHAADLTARDAEGRTALHLAVAGSGRGDELARQFVEKGAEVDATDASGCTPLMSAIGSINLPATEFLLSRGANASVRARDGSTPLSLAIAKGHEKLPPYEMSALEHIIFLVKRTRGNDEKMNAHKL